MIAAQVALYPLRTDDVDGAVTAALDAIAALSGEGLVIEVASMSTVLTGPDDVVWRAMREIFDALARDGHRVVLTTTVSNECGCAT